jgi:streptogramin lyase
MGTRPNSLTIARGKVWTLVGPDGKILTYAPTSHARDHVGIGKGGKSIAAGLRSIWALKGLPTRSLLQVSQKTGSRLARTEISGPGEPVVVATGAGAVWVGVRGSGRAPQPETVVKVSPGTLGQQPIDVPGGVQYIAVGEGALWVSERFRRAVLRIELSDGSRREIAVDGLPQGITVGEHAVWVATNGADTITRINPRSGQTRRIDVDYSPTQVAVGGGSVWATARAANRLIRIDATTRKVLDNIETGIRPFALDVSTGNSVWITLLGQDSIQQVTYTR